jgi:hypothetical protein
MLILDSRRAGQPGSTLIEVLVVIAVPIALLLPAA